MKKEKGTIHQMTDKDYSYMENVCNKWKTDWYFGFTKQV